MAYIIMCSKGIRLDDYSLDFDICEYNGYLYHDYDEAKSDLEHARIELGNSPDTVWIEVVED